MPHAPQFTGREFDPETGLYYYRSRYYAPQAGRFTTADPIGLLGGPNLYVYVNNNPVNWIDPWGLVAPAIPIVVYIVIGFGGIIVAHMFFGSEYGGPIPPGAYGPDYGRFEEGDLWNWKPPSKKPPWMKPAAWAAILTALAELQNDLLPKGPDKKGEKIAVVWPSVEIMSLEEFERRRLVYLPVDSSGEGAPEPKVHILVILGLVLLMLARRFQSAKHLREGR